MGLFFCPDASYYIDQMRTAYEDTLDDQGYYDYKKKLASVETDLEMGFPLQSALNAAQCTPEERAEILARPELNDLVAWGRAQAERRAFKLHVQAQAIAAARGNAMPVQWFMERLNPDVWKPSEASRDASPVYIVIPAQDQKVV